MLSPISSAAADEAAASATCAGTSTGGDAREPIISTDRLIKRAGREPSAQPAQELSTLLVVPPFCSPNYTYPAAAYLTRFLKRRGYRVRQADLNIELMLKIFSRSGLTRVFAAAERSLAERRSRESVSEHTLRALSLQGRYVSLIDDVIRFLQGHSGSLAYRLCHPGFLPRGKHFDLNKGFDMYDGSGNTIAVHDRAKFVATLFLYDIAEVIRELVFPYFQITLVDRYYDDFVHRCTTFERMQAELERVPNVIDELLIECFDAHFDVAQPDLVGVTVPFARNLYYAFRLGRRAKQRSSDVKVAMGGGFFNTSMREQKDARVFDYVDFITLDDGEKPILNLLEHLQGTRSLRRLKRTWHRKDDALFFDDGDPDADARHSEAGAPDYSDLRVADYFSSLETTNVNQRVRSDGWWNKLTMTHGCYWKKCSFCDIHLSYVGDYDTATAQNLVDKAQEAIAQTGQTGFHFVDEAMPPKVMRDFAMELLRRDLHITWHGMLRFDKAYTLEQCKLLAASGLIAVFGGLEVASDRLLTLMKKGTTVEQVARVAKNFKDAGIRVHGYIMYGFPTQTAQETIDALDVVRQLFKHGLLTSASWARFGVTPHSPIGRNPDEYKIQLLPMPEGTFVEQIIPHVDPTGADHGQYEQGLQNALRYFTLGYHHDTPVEGWFDFPVPAVSIDRDWIGKVVIAHEKARQAPPTPEPNQRDRRVLWLGASPEVRMTSPANGKPAQGELLIHDAQGVHRLSMPLSWAQWLLAALERTSTRALSTTTLSELEASWDLFRQAHNDTTPFKEFLVSSTWQAVRERGLALL